MKNALRLSVPVILSILAFGASAPLAFAAISTITVTSPNGGEIWSGTHNITWSTVPVSDPGIVNIYLVNDFDSSVSSIISGEANDGTYSWDTTSTTGGSTYRIRIAASADTNIKDDSNATFTVDNTAPTAPNAPTTAAGPDINAAEKAAGVAINVVLGTSGAVAGDTLELLIGGSSFSTQQTHVLTGGEASSNYTFTVPTGAGWGSDGAKSITARVTDIASPVNVGVASTALALNLDTVVPTVTLASATASPTNGLIAVTAEFSENVTGFDISDITVSGGVAGSFVAVDGNSYTFNVDPTDGAAQAVTIDVLADKALDVAGNNNTASNQITRTSDTVAPTFTAARTSLNTIVLTFSENITSGGVDTDSFLVTGATTVSAGAVVGSTSITLTTAGLVATDGTPAVNYVEATGDVADTATNEVADGGAVAAADQVSPTVVITDDEADVANIANSDVVYTFTFSEAVTGFTVGDVTVSGGTKGTFTAVSGTVYTLAVTPASNSTTNITVDVAGGVAVDTSSNTNPNTVATQSVQVVDTLAPTTPVINAVATNDIINATERTATVTVTGTNEADSTVTLNGSATTIVSPTTWSFILSGAAIDAFGQGAETLTAIATDIAGNPNTVNGTRGIAVDTAVPAITSITSNATGAGVLKIGDTILFTLTPGATEAGATVTGSYNGVTLTWSTADSGITYTATYTVASGNTDQTSALQISGVTITDAAGNTSASADGIDVVKTIDANAPSAPTTPDMTAPSDFNISTDNITKVANPTFEGTAESGSTVTVYDGATSVGTGTATGGNYSITVSILSDGVHSITAKTVDAAGNVSAASSALSVTIDTGVPSAPTTPDMTIGTDSNITTDNVTNDATPDFTTTAEAGSAITVYDGLTPVGSMTATGGTDTITVSTLSDGAHNITVKTMDVAGNTSSASSALPILIDTSAAITSITSNATGAGVLKIGDTILFTLTPGATEAGATVTGSYNGVTLTWSTADSGITYTATYTVASGNTDQTSALQISGVTITDVAGNTSSATAGIDVVKTIDANAPTLVSARTNSVTTIDLTFSEDLDGTTVTNSDFSVSGYTLDSGNDAFEITSGVVRLTVTVAFGTGATPAVTYSGMVKDLAGNTAPIAGPITPTDGVAPTLSSVTIASNNGITTLAKTGNTITLSITASEALTSTPTVTIGGNVASVSGTGPYSATYTMTGTDTEGGVAFTINFSDVAGNTGTQVTAVTSGSGVLFDRTVPTVDAGSDKNVNAVASQDATTSDAGSGLASHSWTKQSGPGTITFGTPTAVDTTISANTDGTYVIRLTVLDAAGNSALDEITFIWDTTLPEPLTASPSDGSTGVALAAGTAMVTYDENIVLLDATRVLLVNDATSASYKSSTSISGLSPTILNIGYSGLDYGTKYRINVKPNALEDVAGNNVATNFISYFTTTIDTIVPVVNSLSAGSITTTGVTLSVTTDESATCKYATTDSVYSGMTAFDVPNTGTSHTATITGLTPSTGYDYYVRCADTSTQANTMTTSASVSFNTLTPDTTAPVISNIQSSGISSSGATITWTTDESSGGTVEYGLTSSYGATQAQTGGAGTSHTATLSGLTSGSTYHFRVISTDGASNTGTSGDNSFDTVVVLDTTVPPTPSITTGTAIVNSDSYQISGTAGADTPAPTVRTISVYNGATLAGTASVPIGQTGWSVTVALTQNATSTFTAISADSSGNVSVASAPVDIGDNENIGADLTTPDAPAITTGPVTVDANTYEIVGTEANDGSVRTISLFESGSVIGTAVLPVGQTDWAVTVTLNQGVANVFTAKATDEAGNTSAASASVTITEATVADTTAPVFSNIQTGSITTSGATITWTTDENATSLVEYGLTSTYGATTAVDSIADLMSHSIAISALSSGTEYHYRVVSADTIGNTASSTDSTFTTAINDTAALAVTGIDTVRSFATADNTFANGWKWTFHVTVPTSETTFKMKFGDFVSGSNSVLAADNIRIYSAQSSNASVAGTALTISAADTYSADMTLNSDLSSGTAGRQIDVTVEVKVPVSTVGGSYGTSYGVQSL